MSSGLTKDASIWRLLSELVDQLDAHEFQVIDHWDADLYAIGLSRADQPERLVYISTYRKSPGHYSYECETPHPDEEYKVTERADDVNLEQLVKVIRQHLSLNSDSPGE